MFAFIKGVSMDNSMDITYMEAALVKYSLFQLQVRIFKTIYTS